MLSLRDVAFGIFSLFYFALAVVAAGRLYIRWKVERELRELFSSEELHHSAKPTQRTFATAVLVVLAVYGVARSAFFFGVGLWESEFTSFAGIVWSEVPAILYLVLVQFLILVWNHQLVYFALVAMNESYQRGQVASVALWFALLAHLFVLVGAAVMVSVFDSNEHAWTMALVGSVGGVSFLCGVVFIYLGHKIREVLGIYATDPEAVWTRHKATMVSMTLGVWCVIRGLWMGTFPIADHIPTWSTIIRSEVSYFTVNTFEFGSLCVAVVWLLRGNSPPREEGRHRLLSRTPTNSDVSSSLQEHSNPTTPQSNKRV